jgi:hypothetical protein
VSGVRNRRARLESALLQERERSADLARQVSLLQPPLVALTLVSDRSRDNAAQIPRVWIKPSTQRIIVEIALPNGETTSCDVRLAGKSAKAPILTARLLPITSPSGDARLLVDVPARGLEPGVYSFVVSSLPPATHWEKYYDFELKVAN